LDADDWLYPGAMEINMSYLEENKQAALVSGAYDNVYESKNLITECKIEVTRDHYVHLLDYNYIGMISVVLFRRWVFDEFLFDTNLKACEDHDVYLKIAWKYPVIHHTEKIAAYRRLSESMSSNIPRMVSTALTILKRQRNKLRSSTEKIYTIGHISRYISSCWT
jgi:hypothetical protein